jgi:hypothetical protein
VDENQLNPEKQLGENVQANRFMYVNFRRILRQPKEVYHLELISFQKVSEVFARKSHGVVIIDLLFAKDEYLHEKCDPVSMWGRYDENALISEMFSRAIQKITGVV